MMMDCLGKIAQSEVQKQSKAMVQSFMPEVEVIDNKLMDLSEDISTKAMGINSAMISINDRLIDIHVGKAIWEYILVAFIALALGVFGSLRLVQVFYGQMLKHGYQTEIQLAEKRGKNEYRKSIVENNSGMVELKKLEKGYVQKHRDSYKDPDLYLEGLTTKINELKNNNRFKD